MEMGAMLEGPGNFRPEVGDAEVVAPNFAILSVG